MSGIGEFLLLAMIWCTAKSAFDFITFAIPQREAYKITESLYLKQIIKSDLIIHKLRLIKMFIKIGFITINQKYIDLYNNLHDPYITKYIRISQS